ncbi:hypothetical protein H6F91_11960 [Leptolyngbya sp. FACHB-8]|nr:hypothetical protein [Leptolyngbya sp. FACHB-8]
MDWSKVKLPTPKNSRPQVGELGTLDYWKLVIASKLVKKSLAAMLQSAAYNYLASNWEEHERRLMVEAQSQGKSPEKLFMEMIEEDTK